MRVPWRWGWICLLPLLTGCQEWEAVRSWTETHWDRARQKRIDVTWFTESGSAWMWRQWAMLQRWLRGRLPDVPLRFEARSAAEATLSPRLEVAVRDIRLKDLPISELRWWWERPRLGLAVSRAGWDAFYDQRWPLEVTLSEEDVQECVGRRAPALQGVRFRLQPDQVTGEIALPFLGMLVPVQLETGLAWRERRQLILTRPRASLNGRPLPAAWIEPFLDQVNPLFDSQRDLNLPFPVEWDAVRIEEGRLRLTGGLRLRAASPASSRPAPAP